VVETTPAWVPGRDPKAFRSLGFDARTMHRGGGNILLGDGSVQLVSNGRLWDAMVASSKVAAPAWLMPVDH
jgi:prepilin-type processing-associated H-X9-DG protein